MKKTHLWRRFYDLQKFCTNTSIYKKYITWLASVWRRLLLGHAVTIAEKRDAAPADFNIWEHYRTENNKIPLTNTPGFEQELKIFFNSYEC